MTEGDKNQMYISYCKSQYHRAQWERWPCVSGARCGRSHLGKTGHGHGGGVGRRDQGGSELHEAESLQAEIPFLLDPEGPLERLVECLIEE